MQVINKIGRPRLTVLDDTKSRFQLIITVRNFRKKKGKRVHLGQNCGREHVQRKTFVQFGNSSVFLSKLLLWLL